MGVKVDHDMLRLKVFGETLMSNQHPYHLLSFDRIMQAVESLGFVCDARNIALNSYENRVYQVGIEDAQGDSGEPLITKFYRPQRWSREAIQEEHNFLQELAQNDIPVVPPMEINQQTLFHDGDFYFALFPRRGGHAPELSSEDDLELLGQWLGRLHNLGEFKPFEYRQQLDITRDIEKAQQQVYDSDLLPQDYRASYSAIIADCLQHIERDVNIVAKVESPANSLRLHGDLHVGNLMLRDEKLSMVDFDDCIQGPAMQDIWMLLSGSLDEQKHQLLTISEGYEQFRPFPHHQLRLVEALRTRRIVCHAAWLASRWSDPAFPTAFPYFTSHRYWSEHILTLREQLAALQQEPLSVPTPF